MLTSWIAAIGCFAAFSALPVDTRALGDDVYDSQAQAIVDGFSTAEVLGQMTQITITQVLNSDYSLNEDAVRTYAKMNVGSYLNTPWGSEIDGKWGWNATEWRAIVTRIQEITMEENGGHPMVYGIDSVHGAIYVSGAVIFGQEINSGASFNTDLVYEVGQITGRDTEAAGIPWVFGPILDLAQNPLWARTYETFGEDPYLCSVLGDAIIRGLQSNSQTAACMKHFVGYSKTQSGHDRDGVTMADFDLLNYFVKPYQAGIAAGALSTMENYISINGIPTVANTKILEDLVRNDLAYDGLVVTDWAEINNLKDWHRVVDTYDEAVRLSLTRTALDMSMVPYDTEFITYATEMLNNFPEYESRLRESARRVIKMKLKLGLYENPVPGADSEFLVGNEDDKTVALNLARESIVLLKNDDSVLPLANGSSVFLTGHSADNVGYQCGGWSVAWQGYSGNDMFPNGISVRQGLENVVGNNSFTYFNGLNANGNYTSEDLATAVSYASQHEYTIAVIGESTYAEKPGDIDDLALPAGQVAQLLSLRQPTTTTHSTQGHLMWTSWVSASSLAAAAAFSGTVMADDAALEVRAQAIVDSFTTAQVIGQMTQVDISTVINPEDNSLNEDSVRAYAQQYVGSYLNTIWDEPLGDKYGWTATEWRAVVSRIQEISMEENGGHPIIYGLDSVHGANYVTGAVIFGQQINSGASFNPDLVYKAGQITARDTQAAGIPWVFGPILEISQNPLWSRTYETFSEDPHLVTVMGEAIIRGLQSYNQTAACMKHFIGYSKTPSGHDRDNVIMDDFDLLNYFLPPFKAAMDAGAMSTMENYISINGEPVIASSRILNDLLRSDLGFDGLLVSDWAEINNLKDWHRVAETYEDAVRLSLTHTSLDMSMVPNDTAFINYTENMLEGYPQYETRLRESAKRIIKTKLQLGLYENHMPGAEFEFQVGNDEDKAVALDLARESIVLLKNNESVLPLAKEASVFLTGHSADNVGHQCGGWSIAWQGYSGNEMFPNGVSVRQGLENLVGNDSFSFFNGLYDNGSYSEADLATAVEMARQHEYTIAVIGEKQYTEKPGDIDDLALPAGQIEIIPTVKVHLHRALMVEAAVAPTTKP
ncbi:Lysosomal beta glucosidase [Phytophthora ramorum]|uniref:Lysosomal beta glucosidase n=1 Tax=Phytophthora ramorum TaxID=164328 RepID=UPI0030AB1157|nr:Lysosomal beta glucosidase [Phytophthora ramorum]KAH7481985.1 Lysosomal beta glucosidase [Phytophthora ramorum]